MKISGPTNPFHIARAYSVAPVSRVVTRPASASAGAQETNPIQQARESGPSEKLRRLIAAPTPGGIDFSGDLPRPSGPALQMYARPADRNAVATTLQAGRMIDVAG